MVSPVTFRHPSQLAKVAATADHVSGGRVELGMGAGWFEREHRAYGFAFPPIDERMENPAGIGLLKVPCITSPTKVFVKESLVLIKPPSPGARVMLGLSHPVKVNVAMSNPVPVHL